MNAFQRTGSVYQTAAISVSLIAVAVHLGVAVPFCPASWRASVLTPQLILVAVAAALFLHISLATTTSYAAPLAADHATSAETALSSSLSSSSSPHFSSPSEAVAHTECVECRAVKFAATRHCRTCRVCVPEFDHHCVWLNTCIGAHNYRAFISLVATMLALFVFQLGVALVLAVAAAATPDATPDSATVLTALAASAAAPSPAVFTALLAIAAAMQLLAATGLATLLVFHVYLIVTQQSTIQFLERWRTAAEHEDAHRMGALQATLERARDEARSQWQRDRERKRSASTRAASRSFLSSTARAEAATIDSGDVELGEVSRPPLPVPTSVALAETAHGNSGEQSAVDKLAGGDDANAVTSVRYEVASLSDRSRGGGDLDSLPLASHRSSSDGDAPPTSSAASTSSSSSASVVTVGALCTLAPASARSSASSTGTTTSSFAAHVVHSGSNASPAISEAGDACAPSPNAPLVASGGDSDRGDAPFLL